MDTNQAGLVKIYLSLIHGHNMRNNTTFKSNLVMSVALVTKFMALTTLSIVA
jgi:hypothetical protein